MVGYTPDEDEVAGTRVGCPDECSNFPNPPVVSSLLLCHVEPGVYEVAGIWEWVSRAGCQSFLTNLGVGALILSCQVCVSEVAGIKGRVVMSHPSFLCFSVCHFCGGYQFFCVLFSWK